MILRYALLIVLLKYYFQFLTAEFFVQNSVISVTMTLTKLVSVGEIVQD